MPDALLYVQETYGFRLHPYTAESLARKFSFLRKQTAIERRDGRIFLQLGPFIEMVEEGFFPDIPDGWKPFSYLLKKLKLSPFTLRDWIRQGKVKGMKICIGASEVYFAKESEVRRYRDKRRDRGLPNPGSGAHQGQKRYKFLRHKRSRLDK
jgi:hypothetical protein